MTSKTKISLIAAMAVAGMLLISASSMVNSIEPIELSEEISNMSPERQPHMEKIFKLLKQKELTNSESEKQALDDLIEEEYVKLGETEEKTRPQYNDHPQLRIIQEKIRNIEELPLETTLVGKNKLTILLVPGNENKGWEEIIDQYIPDKNLNVVIEYGVVGPVIEWACNDRDDECDPSYGYQ